MPDVPRDFPDLLQDALVAALQASSAEHSAVVQYTVKRDKMGAITKRDIPLVNIWCPEERPEDDRSSAHKTARLTATINFDLYCRGEEQEDDSDPVGADQAAVSRLAYLRAQVRHAIKRLINRDMGFPVGTISRIGWPGWQMFQVGDRTPFPAESVVGGRLTVDFEYEWNPEDIDGTTLNLATVTDSQRAMWAATFTPGGGT
jgi:hypothetical protein